MYKHQKETATDSPAPTPQIREYIWHLSFQVRVTSPDMIVSSSINLLYKFQFSLKLNSIPLDIFATFSLRSSDEGL